MCLSSVFLRSPECQEEIMRDVARIEAEGEGFWLINLFGEKKFVKGILRTIDLSDQHYVMLEKKD